ncbi:MAG: hypothetical protein ACYSUP_11760, partial [Planctomycetota bacterium]
SDDLQISDYVSLNIPLLFISAFDAITMTDEPAVSIPVLMASVSDTLGLTDDAAAAFSLYEISIYDGVSVSDSIGILLSPLLASAFDLVGIAEVVGLHITTEGILEVNIGDTLMVVDSVAVQREIAGLAAYDTLNVTDRCSFDYAVAELGVAYRGQQRRLVKAVGFEQFDMEQRQRSVGRRLVKGLIGVNHYAIF